MEHTDDWLLVEMQVACGERESVGGLLRIPARYNVWLLCCPPVFAFFLKMHIFIFVKLGQGDIEKETETVPSSEGNCLTPSVHELFDVGGFFL